MSSNTGYWTGTLLAPLPIALLTIALLAVTIGLSQTAIVFVGLAYAVVLIPLAITHGIVRQTSSRRLRTYVGVMFLVAFLLAVIGWQLVPFGPDSSITVDFDDGVEHPVPLPLVGIITAFLLALIQIVCVTIFWRLAIRPGQQTEIDA